MLPCVATAVPRRYSTVERVLFTSGFATNRQSLHQIVNIVVGQRSHISEDKHQRLHSGELSINAVLF